MIVIDFEVFRHDFMLVWLDCKTRKIHHIINNKEKIDKFYEYYKNEIMVGYNINHYDKYILQGILCGFNPYDISDWIINKDRQGWEYSKLFNKFQILSYDTLIKDKSLKQCEASLGLKIKESSVSFDIDRALTRNELLETLDYCKHDVMCTFEVFLQDGFILSPQDEYSSSIAIIKEFNFPISYISKTKSQMGCSVLGAIKGIKRDDEFDIINPNNLLLGKYEYVRDWFLNKNNHWYSKKIDGKKVPKKNELITEIAGLEHTFAWGGVHAGIKRQIVDGILLNCDFASLYPNIMVEYNLISRNVPNPKSFTELLETRLRLKGIKDPREKCYKICLNGSYGQMGYESSPMYDKKMANNVCIHGQLIALDLVEKLEKISEIKMVNTDGVLLRVDCVEKIKQVEEICNEVSKRIRIGIDVEQYKRYIAKDVNNYILIDNFGKVKAKGSYVKFLNPLSFNLNIINKAIREYFVNNISAHDSIMKCDSLMEFQIISKAGSKYEYSVHGERNLNEKVNRVFASKDLKDAGMFKLHKESGVLTKIEMTPEHCFIINDDIREMPIPVKLDKQWYIDLAEKRISEFVK